LKLAKLIDDIVFYILAKFQKKILICKEIMTFFLTSQKIFAGLMGEISAPGKNGRKKLKGRGA
jgi:hypothetical protein